MTVFGMTDQGRVREANQDSYRIEIRTAPVFCAAVLCDGMGGASGGEVASSLAADTFLTCALDILSRETEADIADVAREAAAAANVTVYDLAFRDDALRGMGTTLVAVLVRETDAVVVNIGDSRCYWLAEGQIQQVTRDHSHVQDLVEQGIISAGEARSHPRRNLITRAVGIHRRIRSDIFRLDLREGDKLLLCSDGLSNLVSEQEIADILCRAADGEQACRELLDVSLDRGAPDNVTVVWLER